MVLVVVGGAGRVQEHHRARDRGLTRDPVLAGMMAEIDVDASLEQCLPHLGLGHVADRPEVDAVAQRGFVLQEPCGAVGALVGKEADDVATLLDRHDVGGKLAAVDELWVGVVRQRMELRGAAIGEEVAHVVGLIQVDQARVGEQRRAGVAVGQVLVLRQGVVERQPPHGARVGPVGAGGEFRQRFGVDHQRVRGQPGFVQHVGLVLGEMFRHR